MDRLWAPWRMQYIAGPAKPGCLFERVLEHPDDEDAQLVLWRPAGAIVLLNKFPYNPGHALVAPRAHKASLEELDDEESLDLMRALRRTITVLRRVMSPHGFNVGLNLGESAGGSLAEHLHVHVVPRWGGDANFITIIGDSKVIPQLLRDTRRLLATEWEKQT